MRKTLEGTMPVYVVIEKNKELFFQEWTKEEHPLMKCGHTANATTKFPDNEGKEVDVHCCVICSRPNSMIVVEKQSLEGRKSKCPHCGKLTDSKYTLPFFEYRPEEEYDLHYDGCGGWD